jgi:alanine dehydrogenase
MDDAILAVEEAFSLFGRGKVDMPAKIYLDLKEQGGDFRAMPAYVEGKGAALKWVNVHPGNRRRHLPTVMATIILSDPATGYPLAILDGTQITNYRTGASGGVAAKYLAKAGSRTVALVGCGEQAKTQLLALEKLFEIASVNVWGNEPSLVRKFLKFEGKKKYRLALSRSVKECVQGADIIVTTTPSRKPLLKLAWLKPTAHINAIGADAPGKQELDIDILRHAKIVVDDWRQARHSGEINVGLSKKAIGKHHIYAEISDIINGKKKGRLARDGLTVFDSTGLAIQDVALAHMLYTSALRRGFGRRIDLVG